MSANHPGGQALPTIEREEHRSVNGVNVKAVAPYAFNGTDLVPFSGGLVPNAFDYIAATYPDTSTEVYTYKSGGSGGTTVATVTVVYSDAVTKQIITSVTKV